MHVAEVEQAAVDGQELVGEAVAHHHAGLEGQQARVVLGALPDVGLALGHVDLARG